MLAGPPTLEFINHNMFAFALSYVTLSYVTLSYVMLSYVMLSYVTARDRVLRG